MQKLALLILCCFVLQVLAYERRRTHKYTKMPSYHHTQQWNHIFNGKMKQKSRSMYNSYSNYNRYSTVNNYNKQPQSSYQYNQITEKKYYRPLKTVNNKCGVLKPTIRSYVANGESTQHVEWPWYVQVIVKTDAEAYCGGTLIDKDHIVTAAHCFDDVPQHIMARATTVLLKGIKRNRYDDIKTKAKKVFIHPEYLPAMSMDKAYSLGVEPGPKNDLAIIKISIDDKEISNMIVPACLPMKNYQIPIGTKCKIMGHGFTNVEQEDNFIMPTMLQMADVIISDNEVCKAEVDSLVIKSKITKNTLCIMGPVHPCVGDSGGPLICKGANPFEIDGESENYDYDYNSGDDEEWYLAGVTSFAVSTDLNDKCGLFKSAVFGKISNYISWIESILNLRY